MLSSTKVAFITREEQNKTDGSQTDCLCLGVGLPVMRGPAQQVLVM